VLTMPKVRTFCGKCKPQVQWNVQLKWIYNSSESDYLHHLLSGIIVYFVYTRSDNKVRELATVCLPWQQWTETSVWFDDVGKSAFHSCVIVDLWQFLFEWRLFNSIQFFIFPLGQITDIGNVIHLKHTILKTNILTYIPLLNKTYVALNMTLVLF
jgi:hypothetical protein